MTRDKDHLNELTPEEMEAQAAEALPERAVMSTLNVTGLDTAGAAVEAVGDGAPDAAALPSESVPPVGDAATVAPDHAASAGAGSPASIPAAEHSPVSSHHVPAGTPTQASTADSHTSTPSGGSTT